MEATLQVFLSNFRRLQRKRIKEYLAAIVPSVDKIEARKYGPKEGLVFTQNVKRSEDPQRFLANNMSDGTLHALGILVALFQGNHDPKKRVQLVGIKEPEGALHPAAAGVLLDALREAAGQTQIIITSHSPDLLDDKDLDPESILAVDAPNGATIIAGVDEAGRSVVHDRLYTTGELLRLNQLQPDRAAIDAAKVK